MPKDIASELKLNIRTVQRILKAYREAGQISANKNSGRPPRSTKKSSSTLQRLVYPVMCPKTTSKQLKANWSDHHEFFYHEFFNQEEHFSVLLPNKAYLHKTVLISESVFLWPWPQKH